jgi:cytochrome c oxidase subunit 2
MQYVFEIFYLTLIAVIISFIVVFYMLSRRPRKEMSQKSNHESSIRQSHQGMEKKERNWLYFLVAVVLIGNLVTLSPLIPSTNYALWTQTNPSMTVTIQVDNYHFILPEQPIKLPLGKIVKFVVLSRDMTYGFGVFRKDGTMVFQMQVVPEPYSNTILWVFDQPGMYDVRSTEYSGPLNPLMYVPNAILVEA